MSTLKSRIAKLEAVLPKKGSLSHLTDEELQDKMFSLCQKSFNNGGELDPEITLRFIKC